MTLDTCDSRIALYKERGNQELLEFWTVKRERCIAKYDKYAHLRPKPEAAKPQEKPKDGKKPKG